MNRNSLLSTFNLNNPGNSVLMHPKPSIATIIMIFLSRTVTRYFLLIFVDDENLYLCSKLENVIFLLSIKYTKCIAVKLIIFKNNVAKK